MEKDCDTCLFRRTPLSWNNICGKCICLSDPKEYSNYISVYRHDGEEIIIKPEVE